MNKEVARIWEELGRIKTLSKYCIKNLPIKRIKEKRGHKFKKRGEIGVHKSVWREKGG